MLDRRSGIALDEMTAWELVGHLDDKQWQKSVWFDKTCTPLPFDVKRGGPKVWYLSAAARNISRAYLMALARSSDTHTDKIHHFRKESYYKSLFRKSKLVMEPDVGDKAMEGGDKRHGRAGQRREKLVKRQKRQPTDKKVVRQTHVRSYRWGAGLMTFKENAKAWQATCPRCTSHAHPDIKSRTCRKTLSFKSQDGDEQVQRRLRHWINSCFRFATRAEHIRYNAPIGDLPPGGDEGLAKHKVNSDYESDDGVGKDGAAARSRAKQPQRRGRGLLKRFADPEYMAELAARGVKSKAQRVGDVPPPPKAAAVAEQVSSSSTTSSNSSSASSASGHDDEAAEADDGKTSPSSSSSD